MSVSHDLMEDRFQIMQTVTKVATFADCQDWPNLRACFDDTLLVDYSGLRPEEPARTMKADDLMSNWKAHFAKIAAFHHLLGNLMPEVEGDTARCRASVIATHHKRRDGDGEWIYWHLGATYDYRLRRSESGWVITQTKIAKAWERTDPAPSLPGF